MICIMTVTAFAESSAVSVSEKEIFLAEGQTSFEAVIEIAPENAYAGVEIGVECSEGLVVSASSASFGSMSAGPTFARGLYWTTFFESDNKLAGTMEITLKIDCPQNFDQGCVTVKEVTVLTKDGYGVAKETLSPDLKIHVSGEGTQGSENTGSTDNTENEGVSDNTGNTDNSGISSENTENTGAGGNADPSEDSGNNGGDSQSGDNNNGENSGGDSSSSDKNEVPETGEKVQVLPVVLLIAAAAVLGAGIWCRKKNTKQ